MSRLVISKSFHPEGMKILEPYGPEVMPDSTAETVEKMLSDAEALVLRTNIKITREVLAQASKLKLISRTGVGVDNVDVAAATERGIRVCHTPGINTNSVAELAVGLIVASAKQMLRMDQNVRKGNWNSRNDYQTADLKGKTLGLVGLGRIGLQVARKCMAAFEMNVIAYDPFITSSPKDIEMGSLEEICLRSDFISVHVPYSRETHHLIGSSLLDTVKKQAYIINTSRGSIVDEAALATALKDGRIAGAGLDVFEREPPARDNPLFHFDTVICSPHSAALSRECVRNVAVLAAQQVVDYFEGREPPFIFNRQALADCPN